VVPRNLSLIDLLTAPLKVKSIEMDLAESRLIRKIFIKGSVAEAFYKNLAAPH
jgi:hypothetical protein